MKSSLRHSSLQHQLPSIHTPVSKIVAFLEAVTLYSLGKAKLRFSSPTHRSFQNRISLPFPTFLTNPLDNHPSFGELIPSKLPKSLHQQESCPPASLNLEPAPYLTFITLNHSPFPSCSALHLHFPRSAKLKLWIFFTPSPPPPSVYKLDPN